MAKKSASAAAYACRSCGARTPKWLGRCPDCGEWDSLAPEDAAAATAAARARAGTAEPARPLSAAEPIADRRLMTGIPELDRVLGGGFVPGSAVLIGGDPGIGKSTLLLQACDGVARSGRRVVYATGEESLAQVRMRADRIGAAADAILALATTDLESVTAAIAAERPALVVVDSVQTMADAAIPSAAGSVAQVRAAAGALSAAARESGSAVVLIGHVTKDGSLAGPRVLEHLVDAVLYFEGDRFQGTRVLRAVKNRFGAASEVGVFEIGESGLRGVTDASAHFLSEAPDAAAEGSVVFPASEGSRVILVEIQSLTGRSALSFPIRRTSGVDPERLPMILAVLEARAGCAASLHDVFVNVVGGMRLEEPSADLGVSLAIASSLLRRAVPRRMAAIGEVGLRGEVRRVANVEPRVRELEAIGVDTLVGPKGNEDDARRASRKVRYLGVPDVASALLALAPGGGGR